MNAFHTPETTMTPEEAEAIVRRHLERVPETPNGPSIAEVAEVLRVRPEEVAGLLDEVRQQGLTKPKRKANPRERRIWLQSGGMAILVGALFVGGMKLAGLGPFRTYPSGTYYDSSSMYQLYVNGEHISQVNFDGIDGKEAKTMPGEVERTIRAQRWRFQTTDNQPDSVIDETRRAVAEGRWDAAPGIRMSTVELRKGLFGSAMRWARITAPIYYGDDALVAEAVAKERARLVADSIYTAQKGIPVSPTKS